MIKRILLISAFFAGLLPCWAYSAVSSHVRRQDIPIVKIHKGEYPLCGRYRLQGNEIIVFNPNEQKMICGDPGVYAWKEIPRHQAAYNIKNYLQDRGYFYPELEDRDDRIVVKLGKKTRIEDVILTGSYPETLKVRRKRNVKHYPLTPARLSSLEKWITSELANTGYPCAVVGSEADAESGDVTVHIDAGPRCNFPAIDVEPVKEFNSQILKRIYAFKEGKLYNQKLLTLTTWRTELNAVAQNTYFVRDCNPDGVSVTEKAVAGKPRLFIFGIGADTEEIIKGKISWKHSRLGKNASSIKLEATGSYRKQSFTAQSDWFVFGGTSRWRLRPGFIFERLYERHYDYISGDLGILPAVTWDGQYVNLAFSFGPDLNFTRTYKGANEDITHFLSAGVYLNIMSHNYEFYQVNPQEGFSIKFMVNLNSRDVISSVTAQQAQVYFDWLLNIANYEPALLILGIRGGIGTTVTNRGSPFFNNLPPSFLYYLGGSRDLRGFKRQELPLMYRGALTAGFLSLETRLVNTFPFGIQPIAFVDIGVLGERSMGFDRPVYWSPGTGARMYTMIGVFRATAAHGFLVGNNNPANNATKHWQFYFSYGEEF